MDFDDVTISAICYADEDVCFNCFCGIFFNRRAICDSLSATVLMHYWLEREVDDQKFLQSRTYCLLTF